MDYQQLNALCNALGYTQLTPLQEQAFNNKDFYSRRNQMIIGPTSSGKTLVPMAAYYASVLEAVDSGKDVPKLLFIVPYRALAAQKCRELAEGFNNIYGAKHTLTTAQSTSEYRNEDQNIINGLLDISVVINEKAFLFACSNRDFISQFDMIVFDEAGVLKDESRGLKLDFLLTWVYGLQQEAGSWSHCPRMFCLSTPFYDWSAYIEKFNFVMHKAEGRPQLREIPVYVNDTVSGIRVDIPHWPEQNCEPLMYTRVREGGVSYPVLCDCLKGTEQPYCDSQNRYRRVDNLDSCPDFGARCRKKCGEIPKGVDRRFTVIADICRWHLKQDRQILIFWNDRECVRRLAAYLFIQLKNILPPVPESIEECRCRVLQACTEMDTVPEGEEHLEFTQDDLYGLFEDDHYRAFCAGIAFHSSAVPTEVRDVVERRFLGEKSEIKIVCSTETLAFGINSAVDVVIVADMYKNLSGAKTFLTANELQNYYGRAGRLKKGKSTDDIVGYVHPILKAAGPDDEKYNSDALELRRFQELKEKCKYPELLTSTIYENNNDFVAFMLLCLMPEKEQDAIRVDKLRQLIESLPAPDGRKTIKLNKTLKKLEDHGLICEYKNEVRDFFDPGPYYYATEKGRRIKGFTPSLNDYNKILNAMQNSLQDSHINEPMLLFLLMNTDIMKKYIESLNLRSKLRLLDEEQENATTSILELLKSCDCYEAMHSILASYEGGKDMDVRTREKILVTAAVLSWAKTANPRVLYDCFRIPLPMLQSLTRELSYLLEIVAAAAFSLNGCSQDEDEIRMRMSVLERSVRYGLDTDHYNSMLSFFNEETSTEAERISSRLSNLEPAIARQIRGIVRDTIIVEKAVANGGSDGHPYGEKNPEAVIQALRRINQRGGLWKKFVGNAIRITERGQLCQ